MSEIKLSEDTRIIDGEIFVLVPLDEYGDMRRKCINFDVVIKLITSIAVRGENGLPYYGNGYIDGIIKGVAPDEFKEMEERLNAV